MFPSKKIQRLSTCVCVIVLVSGLVALAWNLLYDNHLWHHPIFREHKRIDRLIDAYSLVLSCLSLTWIAYKILKRKSTTKSLIVTTHILFGLYNCAALATLILFVYNSFDFKRDYNDMRLDNQLMSEDVVKFHESVDSVVARSTNHTLYLDTKPNDYMMLAARCGYAPAQNYIGLYFYEQAKQINNNHYGYNRKGQARWNNSMTEYCEEELNRATYWWLKAAEQNFGPAQENLGMTMMKAILGNQPYSYGDAKYWLTEAANNGKVSAYYYLGILSKDSSVSEAANYFKKGAEKGDERCMIMLENPDYIDVEITAPTSRFR